MLETLQSVGGPMNRNVLVGASAVLIVLAVLAYSLYVPRTGTAIDAEGNALRPISFVTDWKAQAEHGGFYQAVANEIGRAHV